MALSADRVLTQKAAAIGAQFAHSVSAGSTVYRGSICIVFSDGTIAPAGTATPSGLTVGTTCAGLAEQFQSNAANPAGIVSPSYGPRMIQTRRGTWGLPFDTTPTWDKLGAPVYAIDDQTVSLTQTPSGGTARPQIGVFAGLDELGNPFVTI